jgi:NAD(P)-dependent dehydrogenase (short-subunit alcohol dehydrogenase family)
LNTDEEIVVVFGGTGTIGTAVCHALAGSGYTAVAAARRPFTRPAPAAYIRCDVTDPAAVSATYRAVGIGKIYGSVHCSGVNNRCPLTETTDETWDAELAVNLTSVFYCLRAAASAIQPGGSVVIVGSIMADRPSRSPGYAAAKAGVAALVRSCAASLAEVSIRVNGIQAGYVDGGMIAGGGASELRERAERETMLRRPARPEEIAAAVQFLISPQSSYITGSMLPCHGGLAR